MFLYQLHRKNQLQDICAEKDKVINEQEDLLEAKEDQLEEKEAAIHSLEEEIQENEELLSEVDGPNEVNATVKRMGND